MGTTSNVCQGGRWESEEQNLSAGCFPRMLWEKATRGRGPPASALWRLPVKTSPQAHRCGGHKTAFPSFLCQFPSLLSWVTGWVAGGRAGQPSRRSGGTGLRAGFNLLCQLMLAGCGPRQLLRACFPVSSCVGGYMLTGRSPHTQRAHR